MSGLLQSSCITLYVLYLTWSAMANSPDDNCKPDFSGSNSTDMSKLNEDSPDPSHPVRSFDTQSIIGLVVFILCVLYSSVKTSSSSQAAKLTGSDAILLKGQAHQMFSRFLSLMPCPFTGPKMFWAGPKFLCQTKNLFTYCGSHKHFVSDKKMICVQ